jgi:hypothetical protein
MCFRLLRRKSHKNSSKPHRFIAKLRSDQVLATTCRISLVEDQVDHLQHRGQAGIARRAERYLEGNVCVPQDLFRPDDPLRHRRLLGQEGATDLFRR